MEGKKDKELCLQDFVNKRIEEVCIEMCEHYCRYPREVDSAEELDCLCDTCPLMRL